MGFGHGFMGGMGGWGLLGGLVGLVLFLALAAGLVLLFVWLWKRSPTKRDPGGSAAPLTTSALEVLERRYAGGEIDRDEYLRIRQDLT